MRMIRCLAIIGLAVAAPAAAQQIDYRVSGTIVRQGGDSMAVIERTPGGSVIVAPGDEIDGGRVVAIAERNVRLSFSDHDLLVPLNGAEARVVPRLTSAAAVADDPYMLRLPGPRLLSAINELSSEYSGQSSLAAAAADNARGNRNGANGGTVRAMRDGTDQESGETVDLRSLDDLANEGRDDSGDPGEALAKLLDGIIDMPPGATIRNVNGETFSSVEQGLRIVGGFIAQNEVVRFELYTDAVPSHPLYLFPE